MEILPFTPEDREEARMTRINRRASPANSAHSSAVTGTEPPAAAVQLDREAVLEQDLDDFMSSGSVISSQTRRFEF